MRPSDHPCPTLAVPPGSLQFCWLSFCCITAIVTLFRGLTSADTSSEFPADVLPSSADAVRMIAVCCRSRRYDVSLNAYKVKAGQDQAFWERKGWIHKQDPRGWFQWYTR